MTADPQDEESRPERLHRLDRIFPSFPIYFVTACTFDRKPVLTKREVHNAFLKHSLATGRSAARTLARTSSCAITCIYSSLWRTTKS
jgi:hypothetical protein